MSAHEEQRLSAWLDGELDEGARAAVEAHLARCAECRETLAALRAVDPAARELGVRAPEGDFDGFAARVRERIEAEAAVRRPASWRPPTWTWAVAAALLLAVVTPLTLHRGETVLPARTAPPAPTRPLATPALPAAVPATASPTRPQSAGEAPSPRSTAGRLEAPAPRQRLMKTAPAAAAPAAAPTASIRQHSEQAAANDGRLSALEGAAVAPQRDASRQEGRAAVSIEAADAMTAQEVRLAPATAAEAGGGVRAADVESAFRQLDHLRPVDVASWRRLRERWRAFAAAHPAAPQADEARVRVIASGLELVRLGAGAEDAATFRRDAESYLAREDAPQKPRIRSMLEEAASPR